MHNCACCDAPVTTGPLDWARRNPGRSAPPLVVGDPVVLEDLAKVQELGDHVVGDGTHRVNRSLVW